MALPKIDVPIYSIKLLSSGKAVRYRPFTVKEEKLFLMATESEDVDTTLDTIKQIIGKSNAKEIILPLEIVKSKLQKFMANKI